MLAKEKTRRKQAYLDFVPQGEPKEITAFYAMKKLASLLGGAAFKDWVRNHFIDPELQREIPEAKRLAKSPQDIIAQVCAHFDLDEWHLVFHHESQHIVLKVSQSLQKVAGFGARQPPPASLSLAFIGGGALPIGRFEQRSIAFPVDVGIELIEMTAGIRGGCVNLLE